MIIEGATLTPEEEAELKSIVELEQLGIGTFAAQNPGTGTSGNMQGHSQDTYHWGQLAE